MNLRELCTELGVKLQNISDTTGYSMSYVCLVVNGERNSDIIITEVHRELEARKKHLRQIIQ